jgi:hypothetical protein
MGSRAAAGMRHCYEAGDIPTWETQARWNQKPQSLNHFEHFASALSVLGFRKLQISSAESDHEGIQCVPPA